MSFEDAHALHNRDRENSGTHLQWRTLPEILRNQVIIYLQQPKLIQTCTYRHQSNRQYTDQSDRNKIKLPKKS